MNNSDFSVSRPCYTMSVADRHAELTLYGEIVESWPVDWWTGERIDGMYVVLKDFLADLDRLRDAETLTIHLNSVGGDGYSAIAIHNALRALPAMKTGIVEGVAMSGGSLILCACEKTVAFPNAIILWHHAWSFFFGRNNAPGLHKAAEALEAMDRSQAEIYARKTGKSLEEVLAIMDEERHLTGREALELGLIDELTDDGEAPDIAVSADKRTLYVSGHRLPVAAMGSLPEGIRTIAPEEETIEAALGEGGFDTSQPEDSGATGGGNSMTLEELKQSDPEAAEALMAEAQASVSHEEAVRAERQRIADIDAIAQMFDPETVRTAKYGDPCTAQEMAYRAAVDAARKGGQFLAALREDYQVSGADKVGAAPATNDDDRPMSGDEMRQAGRAMSEKLQGRKEE